MLRRQGAQTEQALQSAEHVTPRASRSGGGRVGLTCCSHDVKNSASKGTKSTGLCELKNSYIRSAANKCSKNTETKEMYAKR